MYTGRHCTVDASSWPGVMQCALLSATDVDAAACFCRVPPACRWGWHGGCYQHTRPPEHRSVLIFFNPLCQALCISARNASCGATCQAFIAMVSSSLNKGSALCTASTLLLHGVYPVQGLPAAIFHQSTASALYANWSSFVVSSKVLLP